MLQINNITKTFGNYRALNDVTLHVSQGKVFGLLGPNGAGKSTLIRIINHIIRPDSGQLIFQGHPMTDADVMQIGYLPEERGLYKKMKVGEQAIYLARLKGLDKATAEKRLHDWFDRLEIDNWWNRKVEELSKGMQQKVQFVVTVLHEPQLLIFDEPFSGFDPVNAISSSAKYSVSRRKAQPSSSPPTICPPPRSFVTTLPLSTIPRWSFRGRWLTSRRNIPGRTSTVSLSTP